MRVPNHLESQRFGFNMTPMIDVVFLLIIFFLVSMEMNKQENRMQLDLSEGDTGTRQVDEEGIEGVRVELRNRDEDVLQTVTTSAGRRGSRSIFRRSTLIAVSRAREATPGR